MAAPDPETDEAIRNALRRGHTIDITTIGRHSGEPRKIEMMFHSFDGHVYISGMPSANRTRAWLHNLRSTPAFTFHLKQTVHADLRATAREITEPVERRAVIERVARVWRQDAKVMYQHSPLVEVTIEGYAPAA